VGKTAGKYISAGSTQYLSSPTVGAFGPRRCLRVTVRSMGRLAVVALLCVVAGCGGGAHTVTQVVTHTVTKTETVRGDVSAQAGETKAEEEGTGIPDDEAGAEAGAAASNAVSDQGFEVPVSSWEVDCRVDTELRSNCQVIRQGCAGSVMVERRAVGGPISARNVAVTCAD
jgi:hypothetical protein